MELGLQSESGDMAIREEQKPVRPSGSDRELDEKMIDGSSQENTE